MTVGERIREYRKQAGLTQKELGDRLGVSNVHIGQYERGLRNPRLPQLKKIADALDIPLISLCPIRWRLSLIRASKSTRQSWTHSRRANLRKSCRT